MFLINGLADDMVITESFEGEFPFWVSDVLQGVLLTTFPVTTSGLVRAFA